MGNSSTKEARPPPSASPRQSSFRLPLSPPSPSSSPSQGNNADRPTVSTHSTRPSRTGRDIPFLGIGGNSDRSDIAILEARRETKQEREARKLEKERAARLKERERSMKEEGVDGGYLVTQGVYVGTEDFSKPAVRQLMIERRIAPFWKGLNDHSDSWTEHQLVAAARGLPIPAPDEIPLEDQRMSPANMDEPRLSDKNLKNLTVPISSRSHSRSFNSDSSSNLSPTYPAYSLPSPSSPLASPTSSPLFRGRAKTLASLTTSSRNNSQQDMTPRELQLPKDPFVNGQPVEAYLYKDAVECPICFIYYPPYLNRTRCCDQPICSECFVQIKRPDPHPPEHEQSDPNAPATSTPVQPDIDGQLVSEPAACPFCVQPEFGITYSPPPFRRGLTYALTTGLHPLANAASAMSSSSSLASGNGKLAVPNGGTRRRATSLSATDQSVITTDKVRPDWAQKLSNARAHAARRSAAATALHTAAYLMNNREGVDTRTNMSPFSRRGVLRRGTGGTDSNGSGGTSSSHLNALALLAERHGTAATRDREETSNVPFGEGPPALFLAPPRGSSSRRSRIDDLEDMMMMEAIRLSLAAEEERRKKEEKDAKKDAKKKEKEAKKAEKAARKAGIYPSSANQSNAGLDSPRWHADSGASSTYGDVPPVPGKGKAVDRDPAQPAEGEQSALASVPGIALSGPPRDRSPSSTSPLPITGTSSDPPRPSHLRHMSNASSSASSFVESVPSSLKNVLSGSSSSFDQTEGVPGSMRSSTPPGGSSLEPMFNFRSLAAMIGDEEKAAETSAHVEHSPSKQDHESENLIDLSTPPDTPVEAPERADHEKMPKVQSKEAELITNAMSAGNTSATAS